MYIRVRKSLRFYGVANTNMDGRVSGFVRKSLRFYGVANRSSSFPDLFLARSNVRKSLRFYGVANFLQGTGSNGKDGEKIIKILWCC